MIVRRLLALAAIACGIAGLGGPVPAVAGAAAPTAACTGTTGVTVVVDFGPLGGGTKVGCAPGDPNSGLAALQAAGFSYGFVQNVPGLVCTIDNAPDPCNGAPSDAYWAYHHASRGGPWIYSNEGAATYDPKPGSVEGWAFGDGRTPSSSPPPAVTTTTRPPSTTRPPATTAPPSNPAPAPTSATPGATPDETTDPAADPGAPAATDDDDGSTATTIADDDAPDETTTSAPGDDEAVGATTTTRASDDEVAADDVDPDLASNSRDGTGGGALVGLAVVVGVAGLATWELRRRRTST